MIVVIAILVLLGLPSAIAEEVSITNMEENISGTNYEDAIFVLNISVSGDNIEKIDFMIQKCEGEMCLRPDTLPMTQNSPGSYEITYEDFDVQYHYQYKIMITYNGTETYQNDFEEIDLDGHLDTGNETSDDDTPGDDDSEPDGNTSDNGKEKDSPGFHMIFIASVLMVAVIIYYRNRN